MKGPVEPVHRSVPETIQEVIELTGFLCFLFRSTPTSTLTVSRFSLISLLCLLSPGLASSSLLLVSNLQRKPQRLEKTSPRHEHPQRPARTVHICGRHSSTSPTSQACLSACPLGPPGNSGMPGMEGGGVPCPTLPSISPPASVLKQECEASLGEFLLLATKSFLPPLAYFLLGLGD